MAQKGLDTCPCSSASVSVSVEQLVKGVRTPGPQPPHFCIPTASLFRGAGKTFCVLFSHLTPLASSSKWIPHSWALGSFLGDDKSFQLNRTTFFIFPVMLYKHPSLFPIRKRTILCLPRSGTPGNAQFKSIRKQGGWQPVTRSS